MASARELGARYAGSAIAFRNTGNVRKPKYAPPRSVPGRSEAAVLTGGNPGQPPAIPEVAVGESGLKGFEASTRIRSHFPEI